MDEKTFNKKYEELMKELNKPIKERKISVKEQRKLQTTLYKSFFTFLKKEGIIKGRNSFYKLFDKWIEEKNKKEES